MKSYHCHPEEAAWCKPAGSLLDWLPPLGLVPPGGPLLTVTLPPGGSPKQPHATIGPSSGGRGPESWLVLKFMSRTSVNDPSSDDGPSHLIFTQTNLICNDIQANLWWHCARKLTWHECNVLQQAQLSNLVGMVPDADERSRELRSISFFLKLQCG